MFIRHNISPNTLKIKLFENKIKIGQILASVDKDAYINMLSVDDGYKNKGNGRRLLSEMERILKKEYNVCKINLLAWQKQRECLVDFYKKNQYFIKEPNKKIATRDDGEYIYELIPMCKYI